ncbi:TetR/AcrR family transcriptional regulator [Nocardiopsis coralliicola]
MIEDLVDAAVRAARTRNQDVAAVPLPAIAEAAGISRSTLLRRLGGSRAALDAAVRRSGIDPGGRPPVRERAVSAAARVIAREGIGDLTLDAVAADAQCSVPSLHTAFGGRDGLLAAVFERYGPLPAVERLAADPPADLESAVHALHRAVIAAFRQDPSVLPGLLAEVTARPNTPIAQMSKSSFPQLFQAFGRILLPHVAAGRIRPIPLPLLIQALIAPIVLHLALRPTLEPAIGDALPDLEASAEEFARMFLRAVATDPPAR